MKNIEKLCYLYDWLSTYVSQTNDIQLQELEDKACGKRKSTLARISFQLDVYKTFKHKFSLDQDQKALLENIKKQLKYKNRKRMSEDELQSLKADVCEFMLKLDNPTQEGLSMTSILYTSYPEVLERLKLELAYSLPYCQTAEETDHIKHSLESCKIKKLGKNS